MAVIGEIQKRPWLLLVVIFVGMLAFILGDSLSNNGGGAIEQEDIATVNGVGLSSADYQKLVDNEYIKCDSAYRILYRQSAPANLKQQLNETYINQYLSEQMVQSEYDLLKNRVISVSTENDFPSSIKKPYYIKSLDLYENNQKYINKKK